MDVTQETIALLRLRLESIRRQVGPLRKYRAGRNCQKGYNCGGSCITRRKNCRKALKGEAKNFSDWMVQKMSAQIPAVLGDAPARDLPIVSDALLKKMNDTATYSKVSGHRLVGASKKVSEAGEQIDYAAKMIQSRIDFENAETIEDRKRIKDEFESLVKGQDSILPGSSELRMTESVDFRTKSEMNQAKKKLKSLQSEQAKIKEAKTKEWDGNVKSLPSEYQSALSDVDASWRGGVDDRAILINQMSQNGLIKLSKENQAKVESAASDAIAVHEEIAQTSSIKSDQKTQAKKEDRPTPVKTSPPAENKKAIKEKRKPRKAGESLRARQKAQGVSDSLKAELSTWDGTLSGAPKEIQSTISFLKSKGVSDAEIIDRIKSIQNQ